MSDREVKTKQTFEEWWALPTPGDRVMREADKELYLLTWIDAVASVILPEDMEQVGWIRDGMFMVDTPENRQLGTAGYRPVYVRPLPKAVELTDDEKLNAVFDAELVKNVLTDAGCWRKISVDLVNGKTLDQLCQEYGIPTTKEVTP